MTSVSWQLHDNAFHFGEATPIKAPPFGLRMDSANDLVLVYPTKQRRYKFHGARGKSVEYWPEPQGGPHHDFLTLTKLSTGEVALIEHQIMHVQTQGDPVSYTFYSRCQ